jgi:matrixin
MLLIFVMAALVVGMAASAGARPWHAAKAMSPSHSPLSSTARLSAMRTAIGAAPQFFAGRTTGCTHVTPMLTSEKTRILAGNFLDTSGGCYVWLNLQQSANLTWSEICKTTLHELGHLNGLQHSPDANDVMYSPFRRTPIPRPCA